MKLVTVIDEADPSAPLFSARVESVDLPAISALVLKPSAPTPPKRQRRKDAGVPRKKPAIHVAPDSEGGS